MNDPKRFKSQEEGVRLEGEKGNKGRKTSFIYYTHIFLNLFGHQTS